MKTTYHLVLMQVFTCLLLVSLVLSPQTNFPAQASSSSSESAVGDTVTTLILSPQSPNILRTNQNVTINFSYSTTSVGGVYIHIRPYTDGALTPSYAADPSPLYPQSATGTGSTFFTISSVAGGQEVVDQLRIRMYASNNTTLLFEVFIPVYYLFSDATNMVYNISFMPPQGGAGTDTPNLIPLTEHVNYTFSYVSNQKLGVRIFGLPFTNGNPTPSYGVNGSPNYPAGTGSGSGFFTIMTAQQAVDQYRFNVTSDDQSVLLFEAFLPVFFRFRTAVNNITHIRINPDTPNVFKYGQDVTVNFSYTVAIKGGAYIWARPFTGGQLSPGYAACGSPVYSGSGTASCAFSLTSGPTMVDKIRIQMWNTDQTSLLYEAFLPVNLLWAGAAPPPGPDMVVDSIEVTQAIQDLNHSVDLVAGKKTYVRVHVHSPTQIASVTATLKGKHGAVTLPPILSPGNPSNQITIKTSPNRALINESFWFQIPPEWTTAGNLTLTARIDPNNAKNDLDLTDNIKTVTVNFNTSAALRLRIMNIQYTSGGSTYLAPSSDMDALESWLRRAYPIPNLIVSRQTYIYPVSGLPNVDTLHGYLALSKILRMIFSGEDSRVVYYGMVDDGGGFMRGKAAGIPSTIAAGPTGSDDWGWDYDGTYGDWYGGHEIGHTRGRYHAEFCGAGGGAAYPYTGGRISPDLTGNGAIYGFDITTRAIYGPDWKDVMTYCDNEWMSDFTYEGIRTYLAGLGLAALEQSTSVTANDFLAIAGMADLSSNTATISDIYKITQTNTLPLPAAGPDWAIVLKGGGGTILASYPFVPDELTDAEESVGTPAVIAEVVPWTAGTTLVEIQYQGVVKASRSVSANAPTVTLTAPTGGSLPAGPFQATWSGADADPGTTLTYSLFYSPDSGVTWETLATGLSGSGVQLDTAQLPGGPILLRVVASDGFLTAQSTSGVITVPLHTPTANIQSPQYSAFFLAGNEVNLSGAGYDPEDGTLDGATFTWSSSLDGPLGTGETLNISDLSTGVHTIALTVTDSDLMTGQAERTVTILSEYNILHLPIVQR